MLPFVWQIILILFVLGGLIAYSGNRVGKYIGKRRLTLFNLRPRHTATAITILSGILIALLTMGVLLLVSQDARTALLGLDRLKGEITARGQELSSANEALLKLNQELALKSAQQAEIEKKLNLAKEEVVSLQRTKVNLNKAVRQAREGEVVFRVGEVVALSLVQAGPERSKLESGLGQLLAAASVEASIEELDSAVDRLAGQTDRYVVKLVAARNVLQGETVPVRIELVENRLIYPAGKEIAALDIPNGLTSAALEAEIMRLLRNSHNTARDAGVLPNTAGSLGSVPYSDISELAKKLKSNNKKVTLQVLAALDIYTIGPVAVRFRVNYR